MSSNHVMIDFETLGMDPKRSPVIQIGAVEFQLEGFVPTREFEISVMPDRRELDWDTLRWYLRTNPGKLASLLLDPEAMEEFGAFKEFYGWLPENTYLWAKPATFDCCFAQERILAAAKWFGSQSDKISFRRAIDLRSYLLGSKVSEAMLNYRPTVVYGLSANPLQPDAHNAVFDCHAQLQTLRDLLLSK